MVHSYTCLALPVRVAECTKLAVYHTVVLVHKVLMTGSPEYLQSLLSEEYGHKTRLADMKLIKPGQSKAPEHDLATSSFRWRSLENYNSLPLIIRDTFPINNFTGKEMDYGKFSTNLDDLVIKWVYAKILQYYTIFHMKEKLSCNL